MPQGRLEQITPATVEFMLGERGRGRSYREIARALNVSGTPTVGGGRRWYASTVRAAVVRRH